LKTGEPFASRSRQVRKSGSLQERADPAIFGATNAFRGIDPLLQRRQKNQLELVSLASHEPALRIRRDELNAFALLLRRDGPFRIIAEGA